jgi:hypothetical protein
MTLQDRIEILQELLDNQKVLTKTYKDHCETLQKQVDEALDLINRSQQIIDFYQNK